MEFNFFSYCFAESEFDFEDHRILHAGCFYGVQASACVSRECFYGVQIMSVANNEWHVSAVGTKQE